MVARNESEPREPAPAAGAEAPGAGAVETDVCVVGGGPAGLALALELARRGRRVAVLEQKSGFERSFRGEAVSPDAVWLLDRLGVLAEVRSSARPTRRTEVRDGGRAVFTVEFAAYPWEGRQPMEIPQPPLLAAMARLAAEHPGFRLLSGHAAATLLHEDGRVAGVACTGPDGPVRVRAALTVIADGRYTKFREQAGLAYTTTPLDRDVLWLKVPQPPAWDADAYSVRIAGGSHLAAIPTVPDQLRIGLNIPKGSYRQWRSQSVSVLHERIDLLAPELSATVREHVTQWSDTALLDVFTTVVPRWSAPGVVLIGDAAHTLSPILGLGVHHALVDGVVLAPLVDRALAPPGAAQDAAGGADGAATVNAAVDAATVEFQRLRDPSVAVSRAMQLRQERAFALSSPAAVALRRALYRLVNGIGPVKRRMVTDVYFGLQRAVRDGELALDLAAPQEKAAVGVGEGAA
ncbi:MAG TPA: FAD-dependent oxidoreductase [Actinocrinis sp.]|nr:FAD-dependent oxidoreductase [Actinocrinis sp.]